MKSLLFISLVFTALMAFTFARPSAYYAGYQSNSQPQTKNRALLRSLLDALMTEREFNTLNCLYIVQIKFQYLESFTNHCAHITESAQVQQNGPVMCFLSSGPPCNSPAKFPMYDFSECCSIAGGSYFAPQGQFHQCIPCPR